MTTFHSIVLHLPIGCKDEFQEQLDGMSWNENEAMIRIGLSGIRILHDGRFHAESTGIKEEYEQKLCQKDQERQVFERVCIETQAAWVELQCKAWKDELNGYKEENAKFKIKAEELEASQRNQRNVHDGIIQEERTKIRHQLEEKYEEIAQKYSALQQKMYANDHINVMKIEEERKSIKLEQEIITQHYQNELLKSKQELIRLTEIISSNEKVKEMEIQIQLSLALDEVRKSESESWKIFLNNERDSHELRYSSVLIDLKTTKEELSQTLYNLSRTTETLSMAEKMKEMEIDKQVMMALEDCKNRENKLRDEAITKERELRTSVTNDVKMLQEELSQTLYNLSRTTETLSMAEKMKEMEIDKQVMMALEDCKNRENKLRDEAITKERELRTSVTNDVKMLQEKLSSAETELIKMNELHLSMEKTVELTIQNRVNLISNELRQDIEMYKTKYQELALSHSQSENTKMTKLQEELLKTMEALSQVRLMYEESKVEALNVALDVHKKEFEEIKDTLLSTKHSSSGLGKLGESYFHDLAEEAFATFDGFDIIDKTKVAHSGDFHLMFQDFTILVDTKNFIKGRISTTDVNKFRFDMTRNQSVRIGWLISLHGSISNYGKRPYIFEIEDGRLLVFINDLKNAQDPVKMLHDIWYVSCFLYHQMLNTESKADEVNNYKRYEKRVKDGMDKLHKISKKTIASMTQLKEDVLETEKYIREMMNDDIGNVRSEHLTTVEEWWTEHAVVCDNTKIKSNSLFEHFQEKTKATLITGDMFKTLMKTLLREDEIQYGKLQKSQYTILGYSLK